MSNPLLAQLENKIDDVIETIEIMRLQIEELEEKNAILESENTTFKSRQLEWEQSLTTLLNKLDDVNPTSESEIIEEIVEEMVERLEETEL